MNKRGKTQIGSLAPNYSSHPSSTCHSFLLIAVNSPPLLHWPQQRPSYTINNGVTVGSHSWFSEGQEDIALIKAVCVFLTLFTSSDSSLWSCGLPYLHCKYHRTKERFNLYADFAMLVRPLFVHAMPHSTIPHWHTLFYLNYSGAKHKDSTGRLLCVCVCSVMFYFHKQAQAQSWHSTILLGTEPGTGSLGELMYDQQVELIIQ